MKMSENKEEIRHFEILLQKKECDLNY